MGGMASLGFAPPKMDPPVLHLEAPCSGSGFLPPSLPAPLHKRMELLTPHDLEA